MAKKSPPVIEEDARAKHLRELQAKMYPPPSSDVIEVIEAIAGDVGGENDPLTWRRFADEYNKDFDYAGAYMRTYPHHNLRGAAAKAAGARMATHPIVARELERARKGRITIEDITPNRVMLEYARIAFSDIRKIVDTDGGSTEGSLKSLAELDEDTARAIKEIEINGNGITIKLADKTKALDKLAEIVGLTGRNTKTVGGLSGSAIPSRSLESADEAEIDALLMLGEGEIVENEQAAEDDPAAWPFDEEGEDL